jgi:hypothetical protein
LPENARRTESDDAEAVAQRIATILRFAHFSEPTRDIEQILAEIERGRGLDDPKRPW